MTRLRPTPLAAWACLGAFLGLAFPVPTGSAEIKPARPSVDELVDYFDTVVFGTEIPGIKPLRHIWKWRQPLRVQVREFGERISTGANGQQRRELKRQRIKRLHFEFVQKHLNTLTALTGVPTEDAEAVDAPPNLVINFVPRFQMANPKLADVDPALLRRVASHGGCYFLSWPDVKTGTKIVKAMIVVNSELRMARKDHCVLEELTQSLGFPNDVNTPWASIFSDNRSVRDPRRVRALSRVDRILIKALYDRRMTPGMPRAEALKTVRPVIAELDKRLP